MQVERLVKLMQLKKRYPHKQQLVRIRQQRANSSADSSYIEPDRNTPREIVLINFNANGKTGAEDL